MTYIILMIMRESRINIFLEDELHERAKVLSILKKTTLNKYIEKAIEEALKEDKSLLSNKIKII